jgi:hypothetical protein
MFSKWHSHFHTDSKIKVYGSTLTINFFFLFKYVCLGAFTGWFWMYYLSMYHWILQLVPFKIKVCHITDKNKHNRSWKVTVQEPDLSAHPSYMSKNNVVIDCLSTQYEDLPPEASFSGLVLQHMPAAF